MSFLIFSDNVKQKPLVVTSHTFEYLGSAILKKLKNWKLIKYINSAEKKILIVHVADDSDDEVLAKNISETIETYAKKAFIVPEYYFKNKAMECLSFILADEKNQKNALKNLIAVSEGKEILTQMILSPHKSIDERSVNAIKEEFDIPTQKLLPYQVHVAFDYIFEENALLHKKIEKLTLKLDENLISTLKTQNNKLDLEIKKCKVKQDFFNKHAIQSHEIKYKGFFGKRRLVKLKKEIEISQEFDGAYYQKKYENLIKLENPIEDFIVYGLPEFRKPNKDFSPELYIRKFDDVRAAGIFPFIHFIRYGKKEKREM